jgi:hypothetical protein
MHIVVIIITILSLSSTMVLPLLGDDDDENCTMFKSFLVLIVTLLRSYAVPLVGDFSPRL